MMVLCNVSLCTMMLQFNLSKLFNVLKLSLNPKPSHALKAGIFRISSALVNGVQLHITASSDPL